MIAIIASSVQLLLAGSATACGAWWTALSLLALKKPPVRGTCVVPMSWAVIVPAHNEEQHIAGTVRSLLLAGAEPTSVLVIADNCTDGTAEAARSAGAKVLVRDEPAIRGKSHALNFAIAQLRTLEAQPQAVAFVDADTQVDVRFFEFMGRRLAAGADIVQAHYRGAAGTQPVARLRKLALLLVHWSRPLGASRLGLPTTLKGNGMAFKWGVIRDGFPGGGITEDAAATLELALRGHLVAFEPRAEVIGLMAGSYRDARGQDMRWEGGRLAMTPRALRSAALLLVRRHVKAAAACLELASPPLTLVCTGAIAGLALALFGLGSLRLGILGVGLCGSYVWIGILAARPSWSDVSALIHVPGFILHKLRVYARLTRGRPRMWERTAR